MVQVSNPPTTRSTSARRSASRAPDWKKDKETEKLVESIYLPTEEDARAHMEWKDPPDSWADKKKYKMDVNKKIYALARAWNASKDAGLARDHI